MSHQMYLFIKFNSTAHQKKKQSIYTDLLTE